jgi:hypothetical protein
MQNRALQRLAQKWEGEVYGTAQTEVLKAREWLGEWRPGIVLELTSEGYGCRLGELLEEFWHLWTNRMQLLGFACALKNKQVPDEFAYIVLVANRRKAVLGQEVH